MPPGAGPQPPEDTPGRARPTAQLNILAISSNSDHILDPNPLQGRLNPEEITIACLILTDEDPTARLILSKLEHRMATTQRPLNARETAEVLYQLNSLCGNLDTVYYSIGESLQGEDLNTAHKFVANTLQHLKELNRTLDFTHFKRHKRGNLQYDGTEWRGVSVHRSWRSIVKNPPTPTTNGYAQR